MVAINMNLVGLLFAFLVFFQVASSEDLAFWKEKAARDIRRAQRLKIKNKVAKKVVLFLGDGNSISTITATRIYKGQLQQGASGEEYELFYERFPNVGLAKTYCADRQVPDSAASGTAYLCGVKTNYNTIGMDDRVEFGNCTQDNPNEYAVDSILKIAQDAGKATGIVTTTRITHATPACTYAHAASRYWEGDDNMPKEERDKGCKDIAWQLVNELPGRNMRVILGGGRQEFLPNFTSDPEDKGKFGQRLDGVNLAETWLASKPDNSKSFFVWNETSFDDVNPESADYLLGLFERSHMNYEANRPNDTAGEPSLADMTEKAIRMLKKYNKGYFLLVEGGRMDHSHHEGIGYHALVDGVAFEEAIKRASDITNDDDTLTIVTADHSFAFDILGYASRGNPILGVNDIDVDQNGQTFTTLHYPDGPGSHYTLEAINHTGLRPIITNPQSRDYLQQALVPNKWASHDGEDVMIYAKGPMAHLFHSTHEQTYIMHAMQYAACIGDDNTNQCKSKNEPMTCGSMNIMTNYGTMMFIVFGLLMQS
ncbi:alkaline phosphatase precursor [Saccoglossus kowalevskii]|uniref:Alkaline phosphatase n=1 Tax=Saccoglossus kowalevskii TaxID=10224 RepID=D1LWV8_SACKO|nr:alkaline phosphatase precursor [Saccoglossus kowalevskii]ACY92464.1 alkaline phosphatase [Saccoglossus kowalevskii]